MNPWPFIIVAYALTLIGSLALASWSLASMRRAEAEADSLSRRP